MKKSTWRKLTIGVCAVLAFIFACSGAFVAYVSDYYHADRKAIVLQNEQNVTRIEEGFLLDSGRNTDTALIFYPGAKVEFNAYLPLMKGLCDKGLSCYLVEMPFNLAFFGMNIADEIIKKNPDIKHWYIAGHSLGGAMASGYASENADKIKGLVLYGAYPNGDFPLERTLTVYGSLNTSVEEKIDYTQNVVVIEGGNHAQFGNYGKQDGDAEATVSREKQQEIAVSETIKFIFNK